MYSAPVKYCASYSRSGSISKNRSAARTSEQPQHWTMASLQNGRADVPPHKAQGTAVATPRPAAATTPASDTQRGRALRSMTVLADHFVDDVQRAVFHFVEHAAQ